MVAPLFPPHNQNRQMSSPAGIDTTIFGPLSELAQYVLPMIMGQTGMWPVGTGGQNPYDQLQSWRTQQIYAEMQAEAGRHDTRKYLESMRGMAQLAGIPWDAPTQQMAGQLATLAAQAGPFLLPILGPQLMDQLGGAEGLQLTMMHNAFQGSRLRFDPVSGNLGMNPESMRAMREALLAEFGGASGVSRGGLSLGEIGELFSSLQRIGMVSGSTGISGIDPQIVQAAAARMNINIDPNRDLREQLSPTDLSRLVEDADVKSALRGADSERISSSLKEYTGVVRAMKDIFGEAGRGDAPMQELLEALNSLTGGGMSQFNPAQLEETVRTTRNLARHLGIALPELMHLANVSNTMVGQIGLPQSVGASTLQHALAFQTAHAGMGLGASPAYGLSNINVQMQRDMQLTAAATNSRTANQLGALLRMQETGLLSAGSDAALAAEAIRNGASSFTAADGSVRSLNMDEQSMIQMMVNSGVDTSTAIRLVSQRATNMEFVESAGLGNIVRAMQSEEFFEMLGSEFGFVARQSALEAGLGGSAAGDLSLRLGQIAASSLSRLTSSQRASRSQRNSIMRGDLERFLIDAAAGNVGGVNAGEAARYLQAGNLDALVESMWGAGETFSRENSPYGSSSLQDNLQVMDPVVLERAARVQAVAQARSLYQSAMAPLGRQGAVRNAIQQFIEVDDDTTLLKILQGSVGMQEGDKLGRALSASGLDQELKDKAAELELLSKQLETAAPEDRPAIQRRMRSAAEGYREAVEKTADMARRLGFSIGGNTSGADITRLDRASASVTAKIDARDFGEGFKRSVATERTARTELIGLLESDTPLMQRGGAAAANAYGLLRDTEAELSALAARYTGGDVSRLLAGDFASENKGEILSRADQLRDNQQRATAYLQGLIGSSDIVDLDDHAELSALLPKVSKIKGLEGISTVEDLVQLRDLDMSALGGELSEDEILLIEKGRKEWKRRETEMSDLMSRPVGMDAMRKIMARQTGRNESGITDDELRSYFGGSQSSADLEAVLQSSNKVDVFEAMLREDDFDVWAHEKGIGFDKQRGFTGDPASLLGGDAQETKTMRITISSADVKLSGDSLEISGEGAVQTGRA